MSLLYHIWHWEDATRFYNNHVNPVFAKMKADMEKAEEKAASLAEDAIGWKERAEKAEKELNACNAALAEAKKENDYRNKKLEEAESEILKLKAKLFDYMMKEKAE